MSLFLHISIHSKQNMLTAKVCALIFVPIFGFEQGICGVGSNCSTNCTTITAQTLCIVPILPQVNFDIINGDDILSPNSLIPLKGALYPKALEVKLPPE